MSQQKDGGIFTKSLTFCDLQKVSFCPKGVLLQKSIKIGRFTKSIKFLKDDKNS